MGWFLCSGISNKKEKQQQQHQVHKKDDDPIPSTSGKFMDNVQQFIAFVSIQFEFIVKVLCKCILRSLNSLALGIENPSAVPMVLPVLGISEDFKWELF